MVYAGGSQVPYGAGYTEDNAMSFGMAIQEDHEADQPAYMGGSPALLSQATFSSHEGPVTHKYPEYNDGTIHPLATLKRPEAVYQGSSEPLKPFQPPWNNEHNYGGWGDSQPHVPSDTSFDGFGQEGDQDSYLRDMQRPQHPTSPYKYPQVVQGQDLNGNHGLARNHDASIVPIDVTDEPAHLTRPNAPPQVVITPAVYEEPWNSQAAASRYVPDYTSRQAAAWNVDLATKGEHQKAILKQWLCLWQRVPDTRQVAMLLELTGLSESLLRQTLVENGYAPLPVMQGQLAMYALQNSQVLTPPPSNETSSVTHSEHGGTAAPVIRWLPNDLATLFRAIETPARLRCEDAGNDLLPQEGSDGPWVCLVCGHRFARSDILTRHLAERFHNTRFRCEHNTWTRKDKFREHLLKIHPIGEVSLDEYKVLIAEDLIPESCGFCKSLHQFPLRFHSSQTATPNKAEVEAAIEARFKHFVDHIGQHRHHGCVRDHWGRRECCQPIRAHEAPTRGRPSGGSGNGDRSSGNRPGGAQGKQRRRPGGTPNGKHRCNGSSAAGGSNRQSGCQTYGQRYYLKPPSTSLLARERDLAACQMRPCGQNLQIVSRTPAKLSKLHHSPAQCEVMSLHNGSHSRQGTWAYVLLALGRLRNTSIRVDLHSHQQAGCKSSLSESRWTLDLHMQHLVGNAGLQCLDTDVLRSLLDFVRTAATTKGQAVALIGPYLIETTACSPGRVDLRVREWNSQES